MRHRHTPRARWSCADRCVGMLHGSAAHDSAIVAHAANDLVLRQRKLVGRSMTSAMEELTLARTFTRARMLRVRYTALERRRSTLALWTVGGAMSHRGGVNERDAIRDAHRIEIGAWAVCAALAIAAMINTVAADFPAREMALEGEVTLLALVVALAAASLWRVVRHTKGSGPSLRVQVAGVTLRVSLGVPLFLFALVVAASGFAA